MSFGHSRNVPARPRSWHRALRWFAICAIPAALAALFLSCVGWLSPRLGARRIVNAFEATTAPHPGFRRNHAKGICVTGHFDSNGEGALRSRASVFARGRYPVVGRLSIPGGDPGEDDAAGMVRSLALRITLPHAEQWRLAMNSAPVFPVRTPEALLEQLQADARDPRTGRRDPAKMRAFLDAHPEARAFRRFIEQHPPSSGYDNATYYGVSAFQTIDAHGIRRFVRWEVVPEKPYRAVYAGDLRDPDFLFYDLSKSLRKGPLRWHLILNVALPGDTTDDSTRQWVSSPHRPRIDVGTLVIDSAQTQIDGPCRDIAFDPTVLPDGIAPSADPLLAARSAAYAVSLQRRLSEEAAARARAH
ncbi:catalase family peroxidase [Paraburkholderia phenoliruptrix]|uniref:catalase family peroxidase n=1 Tax=Paraburkholderia phenoliruptrix TaxID=252970 RepID=UPI00142F0124|nr:catalase family peroxidase [Paraburkholderia phenoliruptrix]MBW0448527.1 catalase family peroxidase [Paraburkholderia phenoliruptrix]MBW9100611.1 catalase family peroxidase [Paraburkholderia phenoliruptrix]